MDSNKLRPPQSGTSTEASRWKTAEFRQRIVKKIMDTLFEHARCHPFYNPSEIKKIAESVEEKANAMAKDETNYLAKISSGIKALKASYQSSSPGESFSAAGVEARAANVNWHEQTYQRVQTMKNTYSAKLNEIYQHIGNKLASIDPNPTSTQPQATVAAMSDHYRKAKRTLEGIFGWLNATKRDITPSFKERLDHLEEQIQRFVQIYSLRQQGQESANVEPGVQLVPSHSGTSQGESSERKLNLPVKNHHNSPLRMPSPRQNMMQLQGQSANQVSGKGKSDALMQQVTKESRMKAGDSNNPSENLSFSNRGGNTVQQQRSDALKSTVPGPSKTHGISPSKLLRDCCNPKQVSKDSTFSSDGFSPTMQRLIRAHSALREEIREINNRLIDVELVMSEKDIVRAAASGSADDGFNVKCYFRGIAVDWNSMPPLRFKPLRLLVPTNYPACSPIFLDEMPVEISKNTEDLTGKARSKLSISVGNLTPPFSLRDIAKLWQDCTREVIIELAKPYGGGTFSSKYGEWEEMVYD